MPAYNTPTQADLDELRKDLLLEDYREDQHTQRVITDQEYALEYYGIAAYLETAQELLNKLNKDYGLIIDIKDLV